MNWLSLTLLSLGFFTLLPLAQRKVAVQTKYPQAVAFIFVLFTLPFNIAILLMDKSLSHFALPTDWKAWVFLSLAALFYGLFERGRFIAAKKLDASTLSIVSDISIFVGFIGSMVLYSETLSTSKIFGAAMIFAALILISYHGKNKGIPIKNILFGVLMYSILGLGWTLDKNGAKYFGAGVYNFLSWNVPLLVIIFPWIRLKEIRYELKNLGWKTMVPAFLNVGGYFLQLKAMETGNATQIIPLVQTSTLLTVLAGIVFLGERDGIAKKILAGAIALIGSYLLIGIV